MRQAAGGSTPAAAGEAAPAEQPMCQPHISSSKQHCWPTQLRKSQQPAAAYRPLPAPPKPLASQRHLPQAAQTHLNNHGQMSRQRAPCLRAPAPPRRAAGPPRPPGGCAQPCPAGTSAAASRWRAWGTAGAGRDAHMLSERSDSAAAAAVAGLPRHKSPALGKRLMPPCHHATMPGLPPRHAPACAARRGRCRCGTSAPPASPCGSAASQQRSKRLSKTEQDGMAAQQQQARDQHCWQQTWHRQRRHDSRGQPVPSIILPAPAAAPAVPRTSPYLPPTAPCHRRPR